MRVVYMNTVVDLKDYDTPVKNIIEEPMQMQIQSSFEQKATVYIEPAITELYDFLFKNWDK